MVKPQINSPDYQLHLPPLGDGTFGTVYRATYRGVVDRAVKVFKPAAVDLAGMMRELEKLSAVAEHQGIVTLHDFDLRGEVPYYVMSLHADPVKGGGWKARTLEDLCGQVDAREAGRLIDQIADAMAYLHRHQVLHCDLKPRNIMLTDETPPNIKICDFGQSRGVRLASLAGGGTPLYASPEQLLRPDDWLDGKGYLWDVYSFGVVAYRLVTGTFPRLQALAGSGSVMNREGTVEDPDSAEAGGEGNADARIGQLVELLEAEKDIAWPGRARIDRRRKAIISRCLALNPSQRLRDMRDVRNTVFRHIQESRAVRSRNAAVLFGAISALALGASGKAFVEASRAREANAREEGKRREAEELVSFIVHNLAEDLDPAGRAELLEHIAENAATYFTNMPSDSRTERSILSFARVLETRGWAALARGDAELALDSYQKAYNLYVQIEKEGRNLAGFQVESILEKLGEARAMAGAPDEARTAFLQALEKWNDAPQSPEIWLARARIHRRLAALERQMGDLSQAIQEMAGARKLYEQVDQSSVHRQQREHLGGYLGVFLEEGELHFLNEKLEDAGAAFLRVTARGHDDAAAISKDTGFMRLVARAHRELADLALQKPAPDIAAACFHFEQELELRETIYWREPMEPVRAVAFAQCLASLVNCNPRETAEDRQMAQSRLEQAIRCLDDVEESGAFGKRLEELRQFCIDQIQDLKRPVSDGASPGQAAGGVGGGGEAKSESPQ